VCLASGSKDPCVRCGHRPSKRMEQLVHLRLKSIYKAFKQSSRNSKYSGGNSGGDGGEDDDDDDEDEDMDDDDDDDNTDGGKAGDPQSLLQAAASAASKHSGGRANPARHHHHHQHHHHHHSSHQQSINNSKRSVAASAGASASRDQQAKDLVEKYMAEKEKADAAAAALLAELDEEEEATKKKKNKKKKKKERLVAEKKKTEPESMDTLEHPDKKIQQDKGDQSGQMDEEDSDIEIIDIAKPSSKKGAKADKEVKKKKKKSQKAQAGQNKDDSRATTADDFPMALEKKNDPVDAVPVTENASTLDPVEEQLAQYVLDSNADGIEDILFTLKGVPGRATLRKNAKKALKKIKAEEEAIMEEVAEAQRVKAEAEARKKEARAGSGAGTPATHSETTSGSGRHQIPPPLPPNEIFRVVSVDHAKPVIEKVATTRTQRGQVANRAPATTEVKSECVMHILYSVVGWVIGKGGQRIRDLMEDSGAKVWIDQEHLGPTDPRIVYISGNRKTVETAMNLLKELVLKAPGIGPVAASQMPGAVSNSSHPLPSLSSYAPGPEAHAEKPATAAHIADSGAQTTLANETEVDLTTYLMKADAANQTIDRGSNLTPGRPGRQLHTSVAGDDNVHEITCEACFVPLLIGRRGWTIKHIQDSSGARVDIDQTVTPRKVKISGKDENVQTAIRMVRDVLSYPHAQLQGAGESLEDLDAPPGTLGSTGDAGQVPGSVDPISGATLSNTTTVEASNQVITHAIHPSPVLMVQAAEERVHTPPPSSTINIGDAKSTISASSSLSSTPEPSMASTAKGHFSSAGTPGPLLPPDFGGGYAQHPPPMPGTNLFGQQGNLHQMSLGNITDNRNGTPGGILPPQQPLFPGGIPGVGVPAVSPRYDVSSGLQRGFSPQNPHHIQPQRQHQNQPMLLGQGVLRDAHQHPASIRSMNGIGGMPHQVLPQYQGSHPNLHNQPNSMHYPPGVRNQQQQQSQIHLHQGSAFHPSEHKQVRQSSMPEIGMGMRHNVTQDIVGVGGKPGGFLPSDMWGDRNASLVLGPEGMNGGQMRLPAPSNPFQRGGVPLPGHSDPELRLNHGVPSLGLSLGLPNPPVDTSHSRARIPQDIGGQTSSVLNSSGKDESKMVDSLFGPPEGSSGEEKCLLTGFQGLTLGGEGIGSDMWSNNVSQDWEAEPKGSSTLFASIPPNLAAPAQEEQQHPPKSRFLWGAAGEPQGQP